MCFVCGPDRPAGDGLRIMAGPLRRRGRHGRVVQAASWTPSRNLSADDGLVAAEFVWAALDCPSGYAATYDPDRDGFDKSPVLLGRLAACISHRPRAGEGCVVTAWETGREGRKRFAECAAFGEDGRVWLSPRQPGSSLTGRFSWVAACAWNELSRRWHPSA
jgi:hypothetical protein